jgi:hypothetical protein
VFPQRWAELAEERRHVRRQRRGQQILGVGRGNGLVDQRGGLVNVSSSGSSTHVRSRTNQRFGRNANLTPAPLVVPPEHQQPDARCANEPCALTAQHGRHFGVLADDVVEHGCGMLGWG